MKESKTIVVGHLPCKNEMRSRIYASDGISPTLLSMSGERGYIPPPVMINNETNMADQNAIELPSELKGKKFRIRKLTPRECFRLMGVDDKDIAGTIHTRIGAGGYFYVIEVEDEQDNRSEGSRP